MAAKKLRIRYLDKDPVEVRLGPAVQVQVEEHFDMSLVDMGRVGHIYYMAWAAACDMGIESSTYKDFLKAIDDVEAVEIPPPGPTLQDQPPDSS